MSARGAVVNIARSVGDAPIPRKHSFQRRCHFVRSRLVFANGAERRNPQARSRGVQTTCAISLGAPQDNEAGIAVSDKLDEVGKKTLRVAIVGGGPAGLLTAIMLAKMGYSGIEVFEKREKPAAPSDKIWSDVDSPEFKRSYNIGIGGRGQRVLSKFNVLEDVKEWCAEVRGRMDWEPDTELDSPVIRPYPENRVTTLVIQRDRLGACLTQHIENNYSGLIDIIFETECGDLEWIQNPEDDSEMARLGLVARDSGSPGRATDVEHKKPIAKDCDLLVGADGANAVVRASMIKEDKKIQLKQFKDDNIRIYKTITMSIPEKMPKNLNYSSRTKTDLNLDALPIKEGKFIGVVLFRPNDERVLGLRTLEDARSFFQEHFPMFDSFVDDKALLAFLDRPISRLPSFSYCGPKLHKGSSTVLVGDVCHTVKPYFGLGVNAAFEDVEVLGRSIKTAKGNISEALEKYSSDRAKEAEALVSLSRSFDRRGFLGVILFIIPIILDSISNKILPQIFAVNTIRLMQDGRLTFSYVRRRKYMDRFFQFTFVGAITALLTWVIWKTIRIATSLVAC